MNHIIGAIRQVHYLKCPACQHQWEEKSNNQFRNEASIPLQDGDELECPKCGIELPVKSEYQSDM